MQAHEAELIRKACEEIICDAEQPQFATHRIEVIQHGPDITEVRQIKEVRRRPQKNPRVLPKTG